MYNITLISTAHSENGKCNEQELYKILESIKPELIFDELPRQYYDMYFDDSFDMYCVNNILLNKNPPIVPLEVKSIKKYKENYNIRILPVDIDVTPKLSKYRDEISFMFGIFFKNEDYKKLDYEKDSLIAKEGFYYLNSDMFLSFLESKNILEKNIIKSEIEKDRLLKVYKLFHEEQFDNRENEMLTNIYSYSKKNPFGQAVFLIGAEHRMSIMKKISDYEKLSRIKINWLMFGKKTGQNYR